MTKLTALELYVIVDTLLNSMAHSNWPGLATEKARGKVFQKLQKIMDEMTVELTVEDAP